MRPDEEQLLLDTLRHTEQNSQKLFQMMTAQLEVLRSIRELLAQVVGFIAVVIIVLGIMGVVTLIRSC